MTLNEIIERENKIAEENQKIVDTHIIFDDVTVDEMYCDDTEVIEEHLNNYKKCAEYHKQVAELLEDYKHIKQWKSDVMNDFCRYDVSSFEELIANTRNKTIDDFVNACKDNTVCQTFGLRQCDIGKIAEQLKGGEQNE